MAHLTPDPPYALVVEEDPVSREGLGDALYRYGLVPLLTSSGQEALDLLAGASAPVLVVLAFRLSDMPASELMAKFSADARWARARVLLISTIPRAYVPLDMRIDGFLQRPFDVESLIPAIQAVMTAGPARDGERRWQGRPSFSRARAARADLVEQFRHPERLHDVQEQTGPRQPWGARHPKVSILFSRYPSQIQMALWLHRS